MSKSDPASAIFMEDTEKEVNTKIKKAYCPPSVAVGNPCVKYVEMLIFPWFGKFEVTRKEEFGGNKYVSSFFPSLCLNRANSAVWRSNM